MRPEKLDRSRESLGAFTKRLRPTKTIDRYDLLLEDLFLIRNPEFKFRAVYQNELSLFKEKYYRGRSQTELGVWFFFPWNKSLVHYLPAAEHQELRTARNKNIITEREQDKFYALRVAYAGLSVGSHGAMTAALMGGVRVAHLADPDEISPSNLNRIRADFLSVGQKKTDFVAQYLYLLNPYSSITLFATGVTPKNIRSFLAGTDVLVEETDNLEMKIRLRLAARERRMPVIMATDNGDGVIVEIERFDLDPTAPLFNGALGDITLEEFKSFPAHELPKLATKIAGVDYVVPRMLLSLKEVGKTLYSWPQLGDAATLSGIAIAYCLRKIALAEPLTSGKVEINIDSLFDPTYAAPSARQARTQVRHAFKEALGLT